VDERLAEINNSISTLKGGVDNMDKCIEELESMGNFDKLHLEMQGR